MSLRREAESETGLAADDLRESWRLLAPEDRLEAFLDLPRPEAEDFFLELSARDQYEMVRAIPPEQRRSWMRLLAPDDAADLVQEAGEDEREALLALFAAPSDRTVRDIMSTNLVTARPDMDQEELARLFADNDLQAIPVVD